MISDFRNVWHLLCIHLLMPKAKANAKAKEPWKKPAPKKAAHHKLSGTEKASAKRAAKKAGRHYPNLVDNMRVAKKKKK